MALELRVGFLGLPELDEVTTDVVVEIVNRAYDEAERGMWLRQIDRTSVDEVRENARLGQLVVALDESRIVGAVFVQPLDEVSGWFGALGVDRALDGQGIGGRLVAFVEDDVRSRGATEMQLELLVPEGGHPHTDRLAGWYGRLGYREIDVVELEAVDPGAVAFAAVPIRVSVMRKQLA